MGGKSAVLCVSVCLMCGCVVQRGSRTVSGDKARPLPIVATDDLSTDNLAVLQERLEKRGPNTPARRVRLEHADQWVSLVHLRQLRVLFVRGDEWMSLSEEERQARAPSGHFTLTDRRNAGPLGLIYLRDSEAAFDTSGANIGYSQLRRCLWGVLWFDKQGGRPRADEALLTTRWTGPLWGAIGASRRGRRRCVRFLFIPIWVSTLK